VAIQFTGGPMNKRLEARSLENLQLNEDDEEPPEAH